MSEDRRLREAFSDYSGRILSVGERIGDAEELDPRLLAEGYRYVGRLANLAHLMFVEFGDPLRPALFRFGDDTTPYGATNTDNNYYRAMVDPSATYRITARLAGVRELLVSVHEGEMALGRPEVLAEASLSELELDADGALELRLGGPERDRNWLPLPEGSVHVTIREFVADWEHDPLAVMHIERTDDTRTGSDIEPAAMARNLDLAATYVERSVAFWKEYSDGLRTFVPRNALTPPRRPEGAAVNMLHGGGIWELADDEALVVELEEPTASYWSIQAYMLEWMQPLDFANRVTSLNGTQVHVDADGRVRIVVSGRDPGVQNWIDTTGLADGLLSYRYVRPDSVPTPVAEVVPTAKLRTVLPPTTPQWSREDRISQVAARRRGIERRFRR